MSVQETYDQAKERIKLALKVAILEDIFAVAPNLRDRHGATLLDAIQNTKREVFRRHFVEEGLDCPGALSHGTVAWETATLLWNWFCKERKAAGLACPTEPLKAECEAVLTEPDEGWGAYLAERWQEEEARAPAAQLGQANSSAIKSEEDEEMPLANISEHPPSQAEASNAVAETQENNAAATLAGRRDNQSAPKPLDYQDILTFKCSERGLSLQWLFAPTNQEGCRYHVLVGGRLIESASNADNEHSAREQVALKALADEGLSNVMGMGENAEVQRPLNYASRPDLIQACLEGFKLGSRLGRHNRDE